MARTKGAERRSDIHASDALQRSLGWTLTSTTSDSIRGLMYDRGMGIEELEISVQKTSHSRLARHKEPAVKVLNPKRIDILYERINVVLSDSKPAGSE